MKQKRPKNKKRTKTINNMMNKQTATSTTYKHIKPDTKDYRKSNYDNQTENKENNDNIEISIGLEEDKNKLKTKTMDQKKEESLSLPKEVATTITTPISSSLPPAQSEVFDSSSDNAMSEMKQAADMGPDETNKVFSHVKEKQKLDTSTTGVDDDTATKAVHENNLNTKPASSIEQTLHERDRRRMESKEEDVVLMQNVKPDIPQDHKESEQQDQLRKTVRFHDELNKEYLSNSLNNVENNNPFISGIKLWQAYNKIWFDAYSGYMKTWKITFKPFVSIMY